VHSAATARLTTTIFRGPGREVHATMDLQDAAGTVGWSRHLVAYNDDCRELVLNMALSIRIALDPNLRPRPPKDGQPTSSAVYPSVPPAASGAPTGALAIGPSRRGEPESQPTGPEVRAGLGGGVSFGTLPLVSGGPSLELSVRYRRFSLGVEGRIDLPTTLDLKDGERLTAWLAAAAVAPCAQFRHVFGCGFVSLGAVTSAGSWADGRSDRTALIAATGPRAGIELPLSERFAARIHGDLALSLTPTDLGTQHTWMSPAVAGLLGIRLVFTVRRGSASAVPATPSTPRGGAAGALLSWAPGGT
jgi:hypothetical protein